jgi:hypothetical protein
MNRRVWVMGTALLALAGCLNPQTRFQAPDESERDEEVMLVGQAVNSFAQADSIPVSGVGLVVGLDGTGGDAPPGGYRTLLEDQLRKHGVEHVKEILASPNTSLVLVSALVPPGVRKGDPLDLEITLPPESKTASLRGGYLKECFLFNYDQMKNLSPNFEGANRTLLGHKLVRAEGPVITGGDGDAKGDVRRGRVWGGGQCLTGRGLWVVMDAKYESAPVVQRVAERINATFHGSARGAPGEPAVARTKTYLTLEIPPPYRLNLPRYLRVVRLVPLQEDPPPDSPYRRRLEKDLLDPARTVTAALRLEALGKSAVPTLKKGLESPHTLVRFSSAEALAYLGHAGAGEELARLAEREPTLRAFCLTALASLDEPISRVKLREMLAAGDAEARYGAFRALRAIDERDEAVAGEQLGDSFWLHRVAPASAPLVHVATVRRAEIVLYGDEVRLVPPFAFAAGEVTVTAPRGDDRCTLARLAVRKGTERRQCSLRLDDVIRQLADLGIAYPELVELLRQAGEFGCLTSPLAVDALPHATSVYDLAEAGRTGTDQTQAARPAPKPVEEASTLYDRAPGGKAEYYPAREPDGALRRAPG